MGSEIERRGWGREGEKEGEERETLTERNWRIKINVIFTEKTNDSLPLKQDKGVKYYWCSGAMAHSYYPAQNVCKVEEALK